MWYQAQGRVGLNLDCWPPGTRRPGRDGQASLSLHLPPFPASGPALLAARVSSAIGVHGLHAQQRPGSFLGVMELCSWAWGPGWASSGRDLCLHESVLWEKQVKGTTVGILVLFWDKTRELCFRRQHGQAGAVPCPVADSVGSVSQDSCEQSSYEMGRGELISGVPVRKLSFSLPSSLPPPFLPASSLLSFLLSMLTG